MKQRKAIICVVLLICVILAGCKISGDGGADRAYVAAFSAADEDYVDFSAMTSFMNSGSWAILEKVKIPAGGTTGWHFFRGLGWEDKNGDVAIQLQSVNDANQVYAWVWTGTWTVVQMDKDDVPGLEILDDTWYTICMQHDAAAEKLQLYVNGSFIMEQTSVALIDDSANTNKLFFGGQEVDPLSAHAGEGDLYGEADVIIAHQAWVQRALTPAEISAYDGTFPGDDPDLFFATEITAAGILKAGGSGGADGINGNTPEFYLDEM